MPPIRKVLFLGSKRLGLECLRTIWELSPETLAGAVSPDDTSDARSVLAAMRQFCASRNIPFWTAADRKEADRLITSAKPDLCFVSGWYWIFTPEMLALVPGGFVGIHFSLLPKYRGGSPLVWAIINGDPEVGLSMFAFSEEIDAGPIWAQRRIPVGPDDAVGEVLMRLEAESVDVLRESYPGMLRQTAAPRPQEATGATYCAMRSPGDGEIDWNQPAGQIHNFVRAQSRPYPGAFTWWQGEMLTIWKTRLNPDPYFGTPGQVARVTPEGVWIVCGDHRAVIAENVEWQGKTQPASGVLKSITIRLPQAPSGKG
jgi:methionyl-tRNA formyltransferase